MAGIIGKDGFISVTTSTATPGSTAAMTYIDSWSLNPSIGTVEVTYFGSSWELHEPTIKAWTATASGTLDSTGADQVKSRASIASTGTVSGVYARFYIATSTDGDKYWNGAAIVESWSLDSAVKDKVAFTLNMKGTGALSYTTTPISDATVVGVLDGLGNLHELTIVTT